MRWVGLPEVDIERREVLLESFVDKAVKVFSAVVLPTLHDQSGLGTHEIEEALGLDLPFFGGKELAALEKTLNLRLHLWQRQAITAEASFSSCIILVLQAFVEDESEVRNAGALYVARHLHALPTSIRPAPTRPGVQQQIGATVVDVYAPVGKPFVAVQRRNDRQQQRISGQCVQARIALERLVEGLKLLLIVVRQR